MEVSDPVIDLWTFDVGLQAASGKEYAAAVVERTLHSWREGAGIVLWPEYLWAGLERYLPEPERSLAGIAKFFWQGLWPDLHKALSMPGKAVVLGSVPASEGSGMRNRAPIIHSSEFSYQDKLHLTPWENEITRGEKLITFEHAGMRCATVICLDIEIPEIAASLRGKGVDLILVPSATETALGCERIARCASARAVELGCGVVVSHLVGRSDTSLIDENVGRLAAFLPAQFAFADLSREHYGELHTDGFHCHRLALPLKEIRRARMLSVETNPSRCLPNTFL